MSKLKELIEQRNNPDGDINEINKQICGFLGQPCLDTLFLYEGESPVFEINGMNEKAVHGRLFKVLSVKHYEGISENDFEDLGIEDVKRTLDYLVSQKKVKNFWGGYSIGETQIGLYLKFKKNSS